MDTPLYLLLGLLIVALIFAGPLLKNRLNRKPSVAESRVGQRFAAARLATTLGEFGSSLVIDAPEPLAREIVASAMSQRQNNFVIRSDGRYGIRFAEPDDTVIGLVSDSGGTRLQIDTFREYMGSPQTAPLWIELRSLVASAARARDVSVIDGTTTTFVRGELIDDRNARWMRDA